jgi:hypothetical protein
VTLTGGQWPPPLALRPAAAWSAKVFASWLGLIMEGARLSFESQQVIGLRLLKLARGGTAAHAEIIRMTTEKIAAVAEGSLTLAVGGSGRQVLRRYRSHVRANARRLSRIQR